MASRKKKTRKGRGRKGKKTKGKDGNNNEEEDTNAIFHDAFDKIWTKRELPMEDHLPPKPSKQAMQDTFMESYHFEESQKGAPSWARHRYFLVNYGIEMLEHYQTQRSLHMDLIIYTFFVVQFCIYTFNNVTVNDAVHIKDAFSQSLVDFPYILGNESFDERAGAAPRKTMWNVKNRADIMPWIDKVLIGSPYGPFGSGGVANTSNFGMVGDQNVVFGKIRIRQVRTKPDSCTMHPVLGTVLTARACYESHSPQFKDTASFGPGTAKAAWNDLPMPERGEDGKYTYRTARELSLIKRTTPVDGKSEFYATLVSPFFYGVYGRYDFGGYAVDLPKGDPKHAHQIVKQLISDNWIDEGTAFVTVSMTTYNPQANMFMYCQLYFEAPPSGFVSPGATFRPFRMPGLKFKTPGGSDSLFDYYLNRAIFSIWVLFWFTRLCLKGYHDYRSLDIWDVVDLVNLLLLTWQILNRFQWETNFTMVTTFDSYAGHPDSYMDFYHLSWLFESERLLTGINGILVFIKYFKLTRVVVRLSMIVHVMEIAAKELFSWIIIAGMLFASLAFAAHISFGATLIEFHTLVRSFMTLFNYLIGLYEQAPDSETDLTMKTGYRSLHYAGLHAHVFVAEGGFFFAFFNLCYYFLLTRILVAMLISAYSRVLREIERDEEMEKELKKMRSSTDEHVTKTWHDTWYGKLWFLYFDTSDEVKVLARLKSTPELMERGYLSYVELREALSGTVKKEENLDPICKRLINLQRIHLHRVPDITGVLKDRKWSKATSLETYMQQHQGEHVQEINDAMIEKLKVEEGVFAMEHWDRDIMSGDVLHSAIYVFRKHLDDEFKKFSAVLKRQQRSLRQIMEQLILIETRIGRAYSYYTGEKLQHTFYTSEEGKALFEEYHAKILQEREEKKRAEIEMMEGENEGEDIESGSDDDDDDESKDVDVGDIEMVETKK